MSTEESAPEKRSTRTCRGSYTLGTACGSCSRCEEELKRRSENLDTTPGPLSPLQKIANSNLKALAKPRHQDGLGFEALGDKVIAEVIPVGKSLGGIDLPADSSYAETPRYKIVSVGEGFLAMDGSRVPLGVEPGDLIMQAGKIRKYSFAGVDYILLPYGEIFSIQRKNTVT